jgi:hypothetical protein
MCPTLEGEKLRTAAPCLPLIFQQKNAQIVMLVQLLQFMEALIQGEGAIWEFLQEIGVTGCHRNACLVFANLTKELSDLNNIINFIIILCTTNCNPSKLQACIHHISLYNISNPIQGFC